MGILQINQDWRIQSTTECWQLEKRRIPQKGKKKGMEFWDAWAYCSSIERVYESLCEHVARDLFPDFPKISQEIKQIGDTLRELKRL